MSKIVFSTILTNFIKFACLQAFLHPTAFAIIEM